MTAFELIATIGAACGVAMVLGGIWLIANGQITLASTPQVEALTIEWKKQFRMSTQVPGIAFFLVGLIFVVIPLMLLRPPVMVPLEFEGEIKGAEEPVSISIRPTTNWELPGTTAGKVNGVIYPDLSVVLLVINAPGYEPVSKSIKISPDGRRLAQFGTLELRRTKLRKTDLAESIAGLPFEAPPAATNASMFGVPQ
jgi:hypothetical protein